jgi:hypothetical protein
VKLEPLPLEVLHVAAILAHALGQRVAEDGQPAIALPELEESPAEGFAGFGEHARPERLEREAFEA